MPRPAGRLRSGVVDEEQAASRLAEIAELPLEERAEYLDLLIDELESALEETSSQNFRS